MIVAILWLSNIDTDMIILSVSQTKQARSFTFMYGRFHLSVYFMIVFQLHEVDVSMSEVLTPTELDCDVACLLYDVTNPRTFQFCARMYLVSRWEQCFDTF